jgi:hypothetical protein
MRVGLTAVHLPVRDLGRSLGLYRDCMGCVEVRRCEAGVVTLEAGGCLLVLELAAEPKPVRLRFQTARVAATAEELVRSGAREIWAPTPVEGRELEAELEDFDGHRLVLWRRLREDELETEPDLPTTETWADPARDLLRSLLRRVPGEFRDVAREGSVAEAEWLALDHGRVEERHAVRAFIRSSPRMLRDNLRGPLRDHGLEPEDYVDDFEC